jgi:hypothetical protein
MTKLPQMLNTLDVHKWSEIRNLLFLVAFHSLPKELSFTHYTMLYYRSESEVVVVVVVNISEGFLEGP